MSSRPSGVPLASEYTNAGATNVAQKYPDISDLEKKKAMLMRMMKSGKSNEMTEQFSKNFPYSAGRGLRSTKLFDLRRPKELQRTGDLERNLREFRVSQLYNKLGGAYKALRPSGNPSVDYNMERIRMQNRVRNGF